MRFWSAKDFFGHAVTRQRPAGGSICFKGGANCLKGWNTPERYLLRVAKSVCDDISVGFWNESLNVELIYSH